MSNVTLSSVERVGVGKVLCVTFVEICERLVRVRSLVDDPHHQSRKQGSAMVRVLHEGLRAVERHLESLRRPIFAEQSNDTAYQTAGLTAAAIGLREVQGHLNYLGGRRPLGTADLFVRKLVAEGVPIPVPTLCPVDVPDLLSSDVGSAFRERLLAAGLKADAPGRDAPVLTIPTIDVLDPLTWSALLYPLAAVLVSRRHIASRLREPSMLDAEKVRRLYVAAVAARLVGEPTYVACASQALVDRLSGGAPGSDLALLARATAPYAMAMEIAEDDSLTDYFTKRLRDGYTAANGSGQAPGLVDPADPLESGALNDFLGADIPAPALPTAPDVVELVRLLADGRPINALAPDLPADFAARLDAGADAPRFYAVLDEANERPCSLSTILTAGLHYKLRYSVPLGESLMASSASWTDALDPFAAHVHERSALLLQSIEAAYVRQMFSRRQDE
jgi:hypothetical protein